MADANEAIIPQPKTNGHAHSEQDPRLNCTCRYRRMGRVQFLEYLHKQPVWKWLQIQIECDCVPELMMDAAADIAALSIDNDFIIKAFGSQTAAEEHEIKNLIIDRVFPRINSLSLKKLKIKFPAATFSGINPNILESVAARFPNLEKLYIEGKKGFLQPEPMERSKIFTQKMQHLKILKLQFSITDNLLQNLLQTVVRNLTELSLNCEYLRDGIARHRLQDINEGPIERSFLSECSSERLTTLKLTNVYAPIIIESLHQSFPNVTNIIVSASLAHLPTNQLSWNQWKADEFFHSFKCLIGLNLDWEYSHTYLSFATEESTTLSSQRLHSIIELNQHQTYWNFSNFPIVTYALNFLVEFCKDHVKELIVEKCPIKQTDLNAISQLVNLKTISMQRCKISATHNTSILNSLPSSLENFIAFESEGIIFDRQNDHWPENLPNLRFADFRHCKGIDSKYLLRALDAYKATRMGENFNLEIYYGYDDLGMLSQLFE